MAVLEGKCFIVTGGARGIGLAFCKAMIDAGATVGILDILPEPHPECVTLVESGNAHYHLCDITNDESLELVFQEAVAALGGKIHGCVTAAGIATDKPFLEITRAEFDRVVAVNQAGTFFVVQRAIRQMLSQRNGIDRVQGSVVMVASASASSACPGHQLTAYGGTKGFVKTLAVQLGHETAATGIRVNSMSPGYINTELNTNLLRQRPELARFFNEAPPMKRMGETADLVGGLIYLLSDAASYVTGIDLAIDGGMSTGNGLGE